MLVCEMSLHKKYLLHVLYGITSFKNMIDVAQQTSFAALL